jgi:hypothetical protein
MLVDKRTVVLLPILVLCDFSGLASSFADTPLLPGQNDYRCPEHRTGGSGDLRTKAVTSALAKHIPGNPTIMMQYMPGGGGIKTANYMFKSARPTDSRSAESVRSRPKCGDARPRRKF